MKDRLSMFPDQSRSLRIGESHLTRHRRLLPMALIVALALLLGAAPLTAWAQQGDEEDDDMGDEIPFDEAELFFELNNTDGDLGIHASIDGEPWKRLSIEDPNGRRILKIGASGRLRSQGLTQLFFESAEPVFAELSPATFFARFPEGIYEIEGRTP